MKLVNEKIIKKYNENYKKLQDVTHEKGWFSDDSYKLSLETEYKGEKGFYFVGHVPLIVSEDMYIKKIRGNYYIYGKDQDGIYRQAINYEMMKIKELHASMLDMANDYWEFRLYELTQMSYTMTCDERKENGIDETILNIERKLAESKRCA